MPEAACLGAGIGFDGAMTAPDFAPIPAGLPATVPFTGPETLARRSGVPIRARLGANENGFGLLPSVRAAMQAALDDVWCYGDPDNFDLRAAIAARHGLRPEEVMPGEGIDGLLGLTVRLFVAPGDAVVTSAGAYPTFNYHVAGFGGVLHAVPYRDDAEDPEALLARAHAVGAKMVYLANPDNPMANWLPRERIEAMAAALPDGCLLVLDEAYADFLPEAALPRIGTDNPAVLRFRTFSKLFGMAGARVGYVTGAAEVIAGFDRIRNHFGLNRVAQAGALAALADREGAAAMVATVARARDRLAGIARDNGLVPLPSATNFVTMDCGQGGDFARRVVAELLARGVFIRMPGVAPMDRCIRVSCGPDAALDLFAEALPGALAAARG